MSIKFVPVTGKEQLHVGRKLWDRNGNVRRIIELYDSYLRLTHKNTELPGSYHRISDVIERGDKIKVRVTSL